MYLRVPNDRSAVTVTRLSYDAIATVPGAPWVSASLLPPDRVEGSLVVPATTGGPFASANRRVYSLWTVVETDDTGNVTRRTAFHDVTITSIRPIQTGDERSALRVHFRAERVTTSRGNGTVAAE
jgi:hypothetical protein